MKCHWGWFFGHLVCLFDWDPGTSKPIWGLWSILGLEAQKSPSLDDCHNLPSWFCVFLLLFFFVPEISAAHVSEIVRSNCASEFVFFQDECKFWSFFWACSEVLYSVFPIACVVNTQRDAAASDCESHLKSESKRKSSSAKIPTLRILPICENSTMHPSNSFETKIKQNLSTVLLLGAGNHHSFFHMDSAASVIVWNSFEVETQHIIHSCIACVSLGFRNFSEAGAVVDFTEKLCIVSSAANQL